MHDLYGDEIYTSARSEDLLREAAEARLMAQAEKRQPVAGDTREKNIRITLGESHEDRQLIKVEVR